MIPTDSISNERRAEFLRALDKSDLVVTDWEAEFIGSFLNAHRWYMWFSDGRRASTDKMWMKYGAELKMPFHVAAREDSRPTRIEDAKAGCCQFLVYDDGTARCCNDPATQQRRNGFRYCTTHADQVQRDCKRRGKIIELFPFKKANHQDTKAVKSKPTGGSCD